MNKSPDKSLAILWSNLSFISSSVFRKDKYILKQVNGFANFGELTALMGPSGAGKSTLLKCINGRNSYSSETSIYCMKNTEIIPCFIVQDVKQHLILTLTVKEALMYASKLKNYDKMVDHKRNIKKNLSDLMILDTINTTISSCSGGQQKRIAICLELMSIKKPNLLCIDEPTSGLDSNAAEIVVKCLTETAKKHGIALVISIHQPNQDVLMMIDKLYVLANGGQCVYFGKPYDLYECLIRNSVEVNANESPIEALLKISSKGSNNVSVKRLIESNNEINGEIIEELMFSDTHKIDCIEAKAKPFNFKQFIYLSGRIFLSTFIYKWFVILIQTIGFGSLGAILGKLYNRDIGKIDGCITIITSNTTCYNVEKFLWEQFIIRQNIVYLFISTAVIIFLIISLTTILFSDEIKVFTTEHSNGWYSSSSYYWAKTFVELPLIIMIGICHSIMEFYVTEQIDDWYRIFGFAYVVCISMIYAQGIGFFFGVAVQRSLSLSVVLSIATFLICIFICGFFIPVIEMLDIFQYISYGSFLRQLYESVLILIYGLDRCQTSQISSALYKYELIDDQVLTLSTNLSIITFNMIFVRVLTLFVLILKSNSIKSLLNSRKIGSNTESVKSLFTRRNRVSVATIDSIDV